VSEVSIVEQVATGLRKMQREWRALGHAIPTYDNARAHKSFKAFLSQLRETMGLESADLLGVVTRKSPPKSPRKCFGY
jgi:hypothetical protein